MSGNEITVDTSQYPEHSKQPAVPISRFMAAAMKRHAGLDEQHSELFTKIVSELTTAFHQGHICIDLNEDELNLIKSSAIVGEDRQAPLVVSQNRLYFGRYFRYETDLVAAMKKLAAQSYDSEINASDINDKHLKLIEDPFQKQAVDIALSRGLCIISGGPGTGKTTIIVQIIASLSARYGSEIQIGLAAPTGKAAMRMEESIRMQLEEMSLDSSSALLFPTQAVTLHRLLGLGRFSKQPRYDLSNPMVYDVVLVDEASMVDLAMMWKLVNGLKRGARLILIGDRDQLASVESGAVLADCIDSLPENVAELKKSYRFNQEIASFADAVKTGNSETTWSICSQTGTTNISIADDNWLEQIARVYKNYMQEASMATAATDVDDYHRLFHQFNRFQVLCALKRGQYGVEQINHRIELLLTPGSANGESWYTGRPIIISRNDHSLGLFNGDIGICLPDPESAGDLRVWFDGKDGGLRKFVPGQIPAHETAWALTIYKSQGSEFDEVIIVLPENDSQILCRELLYTAVTRAKEKISLVISEDICKTTVSRKIVRRSGLARRLK